MTVGAFINDDGKWEAHPGNGCVSFRQPPADLIDEYCCLANQYPLGQRPSWNQLIDEVRAHKSRMKDYGMTLREYSRWWAKTEKARQDPAAFAAMDRNARLAWVKTFGLPRRRSCITRDRPDLFKARFPQDGGRTQ